MRARRDILLAVLALACGVGLIVLIATSDHERPAGIWLVFAPAVGWSFVATGLYAWRRRPESRTGALMVAFGFAWFLSGLHFADSGSVYTFSVVVGGLWGGVFLQLVMAFPSGRLSSRTDRALVISGYLLFTVGSIPAMLFADPRDLGCDDCPANVLLVRHDHGLAQALLGSETALYALLFVITLVRLVLRWRRTEELERLQLTPVYACGLLAFLLVTAAQGGAGDAFDWAGLLVTAVLPGAFLVGLLRSHVAQLVEDLRASRARIVEAGDTERRRLERDLHDGAQTRLIGLLLLLGDARRRVGGDADAAALLDRALAEAKTTLGELRELARGIHPPVLTERGLEPALRALAARAPVPVSLEADGDERLPPPVEVAAYFVVSEALANVAKYSGASEAIVAVRREDGHVTVEVADDGVGGADAARGSGLRGLADRIGALDGTLSVESPAGRGTRLAATIPVTAPPAAAAPRA